MEWGHRSAVSEDCVYKCASKGAESFVVRKQQPLRSCKNIRATGGKDLSGRNNSSVPAKRKSSRLQILAPNCIGAPCAVVMERISDSVANAICVKMSALGENIFSASDSLDVKLRPGVVVSVATRAMLEDVPKPSGDAPPTNTRCDSLRKLVEERRDDLSRLRSLFETKFDSL